MSKVFKILKGQSSKLSEPQYHFNPSDFATQEALTKACSAAATIPSTSQSNLSQLNSLIDYHEQVVKDSGVQAFGQLERFWRVPPAGRYEGQDKHLPGVADGGSNIRAVAETLRSRCLDMQNQAHGEDKMYPSEQVRNTGAYHTILRDAASQFWAGEETGLYRQAISYWVERSCQKRGNSDDDLEATADAPLPLSVEAQKLRNDCVALGVADFLASSDVCDRSVETQQNLRRWLTESGSDLDPDVEYTFGSMGLTKTIQSELQPRLEKPKNEWAQKLMSRLWKRCAQSRADSSTDAGAGSYAESLGDSVEERKSLPTQSAVTSALQSPSDQPEEDPQNGVYGHEIFRRLMSGGRGKEH